MTGTIATIAIGVDGSVDSHHAFDWAAELARDLGADLLVVHAVGLLEHRDDPRHEAAIEWLDRLLAPEVNVERIVIEADPVQALVTIVAERAADLLVVGSRGIGGAPSLLLGSTSTQLLQRTTVPVAVIPCHTRTSP